MISIIAAAWLVVGFVMLMKAFALVGRSRDAIATSKRAFLDLRNPDLDDDAKEVALQRHAIRLFRLFFSITLGGIAAVALPAALVWLAGRAGWLSFEDVMATALGWRFLIASTVATVVFLVLTAKR